MENITFSVEVWTNLLNEPVGYVVFKYRDGVYFRQMPGVYATEQEALDAIKTFSQKSEN